MAISNPKNKPITPAGFDTDSMNRSLRLINAFTAIYPPPDHHAYNDQNENCNIIILFSSCHIYFLFYFNLDNLRGITEK